MSNVTTLATAKPSTGLSWQKIIKSFEDDEYDYEDIEFEADTEVGTCCVHCSLLFDHGYAVVLVDKSKRRKVWPICFVCPSIETAKEIAAFHYAQSAPVK